MGRVLKNRVLWEGSSRVPSGEGFFVEVLLGIPIGEGFYGLLGLLGSSGLGFFGILASELFPIFPFTLLGFL